MTTIPLYRWVPSVGENLGDWLSLPILRALGCEPVDVTPGGSCVTAIGSILHPSHYAWSKASRIIVWGSGVGNGNPPPDGVTLDFRAVRGPVTQRAFHLPSDIPMGDPALLLPRLVKLPATTHAGEVLYVNHIGTKPINEPGGCVGVSAHVGMNDGLDLVARIAAAEFVASESLHGCIVAAAYGVPWAPCSVQDAPQWTEIGPGSKWNDWLEYLGLPHIDAMPKTLDAAYAWWDMIGRHGRLRPVGPLLDAFDGIGVGIF